MNSIVPVILANNRQIQDRPLLNLPTDLFVEIFKNLRFKDIVRFGLVCVQTLSLTAAVKDLWLSLFLRSVGYSHPNIDNS
jgi:hypothetical protein